MDQLEAALLWPSFFDSQPNVDPGELWRAIWPSTADLRVGQMLFSVTKGGEDEGSHYIPYLPAAGGHSAVLRLVFPVSHRLQAKNGLLLKEAEKQPWHVG